MSELDYEDLLRQARQVGPRAGTKQRLKARVLGATALAASAATATPAAALVGGKTLSVLGSLALGALGGTLVAVPMWLASPPSPRAASSAAAPKPTSSVAAALRTSPIATPGSVTTEPTATASSASTVLAPAAQAPVRPNTRALPSTAPESARTAPAPSSAVPASGDVQQLASIERETALIAEAQRALRRGDARAALAWLDRRDLEFPRGALGEEALAARIVSQCQLGRFADARRGHAQFSRYYAGSPLRAHIETACSFSGSR